MSASITHLLWFLEDNPILRVTLSVDEVEREAVNLREKGFRSILLVAGEHPKFVGNGYLEECIKTVRRIVPSVALEVGPMETPEYREMVAAGSEGLVVYQETYEPTAYRVMHTAGPKKDFHWRLATPERAYELVSSTWHWGPSGLPSGGVKRWRWLCMQPTWLAVAGKPS